MIRTFTLPPASHVVTQSEAPDGDFAGKLPPDNGIYIMLANYPAYFGASGHATMFEAGSAVSGGYLYGSNSDVAGGIYKVTLWKLN